jgi:hypothetical protein
MVVVVGVGVVVGDWSVVDVTEIVVLAGEDVPAVEVVVVVVLTRGLLSDT